MGSLVLGLGWRGVKLGRHKVWKSGHASYCDYPLNVVVKCFQRSYGSTFAGLLFKI